MVYLSPLPLRLTQQPTNSNPSNHRIRYRFQADSKANNGCLNMRKLWHLPTRPPHLVVESLNELTDALLRQLNADRVPSLAEVSDQRPEFIGHFICVSYVALLCVLLLRLLVVKHLNALC